MDFLDDILQLEKTDAIAKLKSLNLQQDKFMDLLFLDIDPGIKLWISSQITDLELIKKILLNSKDEWIIQILIDRIQDQNTLIELYSKSHEFLMYLIIERLSEESRKWLVENEFDPKLRKQIVYAIDDVAYLQRILKKIQDDMDNDVWMQHLDKMDITVVMSLLFDLEESIRLRINQLTIEE